MRRYLLKSMIGAMETIEELQQLLGGLKKLQEDSYLKLLQEAAIAVGTSLESTGEDVGLIVQELESYCEDIYEYGNTLNLLKKQSILHKMGNRVTLIKNKISTELTKDKLEVVFMPYKADMWTSLASIWEAARTDSECNVKVVPIPYYDIGNAEHITLNYEGKRFPKEVEITSFQKYNLEQHHPDIVYIHNPYDGTNNLTRVPECYYSSNLKKYADILVYSPYFTIGTYQPGINDYMFEVPGVIESDYVLAQSEQVKHLFEQYGKPSDEILTFGSPKIDAVIASQHKKHDVPESWQNKIKGRKVFLLNTHLSYFPKAYLYAGSSDNYGVLFHQKILEIFLEHPECALIWRPHPLLKNMLHARFPECLEFVEYFEKRVREADNGIVDETGSYFDAFFFSDAMLSTWSSLINEYMVTGKPILIFQKPMAKEVDDVAPLKRNVNYFGAGEGRISFARFRNNVLRGIDPLREMRKAAVQEAFPNSEGMAGEKIYQYLKKMY